MSTYDRQATDRKPLFFRTTRCNKPFERPANTLSQILQLIISAHRLHIFGIRRFDNMNYLKVYKRISVRKICIEIDQLPMESSTSRTASFHPPSPHIFALATRTKLRSEHDQQNRGPTLAIEFYSSWFLFI